MLSVFTVVRPEFRASWDRSGAPVPPKFLIHGSGDGGGAGDGTDRPQFMVSQKFPIHGAAAGLLD